MTKVGVGYVDVVDSVQAGKESVLRACEQAGVRPEEVELLWLFCGGEHDAEAFLSGARGVCREGVRIWGGSTMGVVTCDQLSYRGYEAGAAAFVPDGWGVRLLSQGGLDEDEQAVGVALADALSADSEDTSGLMLLYDSIKAYTTPPTLNMATFLLAGMEKQLQGAWAPTAGLGLLGDVFFKKQCYQFAGNRVVQQHAVLQAFHGNVRVRTEILHGCQPVSAYHTVTASEHNILLELDGRPAFEVVRELIGLKEGEEQGADEMITVGVNLGDKFGEFDENSYQNRVCLGAHPPTGGMVMFEPDLVPGVDVQLMSRSTSANDVEKRCRAFLDSLENQPLIAFYIDCAGRASMISGAEEEEAIGVQRAFADCCPLLGCYTGVEIASVAGKQVPSPLDLTGVICVLEPC